MNLLWLVNVRLPEVSKIMKWESRPYGGWLINSSKKLSELPNIKLNIAYPEKKVKNLELIKGKNINYYAFKPKGNSHFYKSYFDSFQKIIELTNPDLVNIYGTELNHVLPLEDASNNLLGLGNTGYNIKYKDGSQQGAWDSIGSILQRYGFPMCVFLLFLLFKATFFSYPLIFIFFFISFFTETFWFYPLVTPFYFWWLNSKPNDLSNST